ncbi:MAG: flavodoxin family protein [Spirochaetaceae bacterium]|nr:flavodoxin family protein [Spirochaetaceae bacterium]
MKNILILTGSPRKDGNTDLLANAFIEGAKKAGNKTMLFDAGKAKIKGCVACNTCFSTGKACSVSDDFNKLAPLIEEAEIIVFCTPLYWFTFSAQLKSAIDKMYSFSFAQKKLKIKEAILMVCAETDDKKDFEGVIKSYKLILNYKGWTSKKIVTVPHVNNVGDIKNTNALELAKKLGSSIK